MSPTPEQKVPTAGPDDPGQAAPIDGAHSKSGSTPPQSDLAADLAISRLTALRLDAYAQTLRALSPPTDVAPPGGDEVSALTAAQFGSYAQMLQTVSVRFAAAHDALMKRLANEADSNAIVEPGDGTTAI